MLFILRCIFWLSIVYAAILSPGIFRSDAGSAGRTSLASSAITGATDLCRRHAAECLQDAARLTALLEKTADYRDLITDLGGANAGNDAAVPQRHGGHRPMRDERLARAP